MKPCPRCKSDKQEVQDNTDQYEGEWGNFYGVYWVACLNCGFETLGHPLEEDAIEEWNESEYVPQ